MRYGFCTGFATSPLFAFCPELIRSVADSGYDYAELPLICLEDLEEGDIELLSSWFSSPVMCNLFPGRLSLCSDRKPIEEYLSKMLPRASRLGARYIVFGSGKARSYPDTMSFSSAYHILCDLISGTIAPMAEAYGIKILIEPLSYGECNIINTVEDGYNLVREVSYPSFSLMADIFHMMNNEEDLGMLEKALPYIEHVHIAEKGRALPRDGFSAYVSSALSILKAEGYDGNISYEIADGDLEDALMALRNFFRC